MKSSSLKSICCLSFLIVACYFQNPTPGATGQNYIDPTVVHNDNSIPTSSAPVNNQTGQSANNTQEPPKTVNNNQQQHEGVLLSNNAANGIEGGAVPVNPAHPNEAVNKQNQQISQQVQKQAMQQAQKARQMAQEAKRQAEIDRRAREQKQEEQLLRVQQDQSLSMTERKKQQERLLFRKNSRKVEEGTRFTEYLFEQGTGSSQFFVKIPAAQQVAINLYTYVAQDNTYIRTKNIQQEEPVKIYIYENNQKITYEGQFYYQSYIVFEGQANAMYLIRVVNNGRTKLISMNVKKLVEESHLSETLQKTDGQHVERTQNLAIDIFRWYEQFRKIRMLDFQDLKAVQGYIEKYYSWEVVETVVAVILCFIQVQLIQNMLKGTTIV